ncbi:MAG: hypothetical protein V3Q69_12215 [Burkholderia sp.]
MRTSLVSDPFVSPEIMSVGAIASSRSIDATTPLMSRFSMPLTCRTIF